jgi:hypothetical protein
MFSLEKQRQKTAGKQRKTASLTARKAYQSFATTSPKTTLLRRSGRLLLQ